MNFESEVPSSGKSAIDAAVQAGLARRGLKPASVCPDEVFLRRVHLDVTGRLPEPEDAARFLADRHPDRRARLVDQLLETEACSELWAMRWCDVLRVKSEFPINLWPEAAHAYHLWIREALRTNRPWDEVARALLTSSGSNFREPPVNFWRAVPSREPAVLAQAVALTFLGSRIEKWSDAARAGLAALCSRVAYKKTREWKEEIVFSSPSGPPFEATLPDGTRASVPAGDDPRRVLADWLLGPGKAWFARSVANRVWCWLLGRGVVHEADDLRPDGSREANAPSNPQLLAALEQELVASRFDLRKLLRAVLVSATYQQAPVPRTPHAEIDALFGRYRVRRLEAEVIVDAIHQVTGTSESYQSPTPEPFTFVPEEVRAVALPDACLTSPVLEVLGRPARDTGLVSERNDQPTEAQRLHLLNSRDVHDRIRQGFARGRFVPVAIKGKPREAVERIYLLVLSRPPSPEEVEAIQAYGRGPGMGPAEVGQDLVWALLNSKEFLYRH